MCDTKQIKEKYDIESLLAAGRTGLRVLRAAGRRIITGLVHGITPLFVSPSLPYAAAVYLVQGCKSARDAV